MGLAASQARFLTLTARKSNIEYQGQQINQQRTVLANKSADIVNKMLALDPPTPPTSSSNSYYKVAQNFTNQSTGTVNNIALGKDVNGLSQKIKSWTLVDAVAAGHPAPTAATTQYAYKITYSYMDNGQEMEGSMYTTPVTVATAGDEKSAISALESTKRFDVDDKTGNIVKSMIIDNATSFGGTGTSTYDDSDLIYGTSFDDISYNTAMNQYDFDKYTYDKAISDINAETAGIQQQDKSLELKLKQLDSEHTAVSTELDAVKQVINKNVESTFKTFSS